MSHAPTAVMPSLVDPSPYAEHVRRAGALLVVQVCDLEEAGRAAGLGAAGVLIGTRFQATVEALVEPATSKAFLEGRGQDTERSNVLDIARNSPWPSKYSARTLLQAGRR
ncbi:hypothetical protein [Actinomadura sp. NPDC049753]|uniref:hypothetical protein n=1 Tax=Actinomadura sp. NPDC049753 TaxID=3154739 RepID=UPI00343282D2